MDQWVVLVFASPDPMQIETVRWAIGPFYEGEAALVYVKDQGFLNCQIMQLCSAPGVNESPFPGPRIITTELSEAGGMVEA